MASYGSVARPVDLGPFSRIIEVHWATTFLRVGFSVSLDVTAQGEPATGPGPAYVEPFSEGFCSVAEPTYGADPPDVSIWRGGDWVDLESDEVTIEGTPDLPSAYTFDDWEVQGISSASPGGLTAPILRFIEEEGTAPDINLPDADLYVTNLVPNGEVVAQNFISGPQPAPFSGVAFMWATFDPTLVQKETFSLDVAGLTAVYRERIYEPIATRVSGGALSVLLKRQALPPSP